MARPAHVFAALTGLAEEQKERFYLARLAVATLVNVQLKPEDRMQPDQLWPDKQEEPETISPDEERNLLAKSVEFLKNL